MTTIRDMPLDCPEATYVEPVYKEAGMRNFTNLVRTMLNDYGGTMSSLTPSTSRR